MSDHTSGEGWANHIDAGLRRHNAQLEEREDDADRLEAEKRFVHRESERVTRAMLRDFALKNGLLPPDEGPDGDGSDLD